jgi:hypothetical protein
MWAQEPTWLEVQQKTFAESMIRLHEEGRQAILRRVQGIRDSVSDLLKRNEEADEIERLERSDFVIDTEQERQLLEQKMKRTREVCDFTCLPVCLLVVFTRKLIRHNLPADRRSAHSVQSHKRGGGGTSQRVVLGFTSGSHLVGALACQAGSGSEEVRRARYVAQEQFC